MSELAVETFPDAAAAAKRAARYVSERARTAVADQGSFAFAVSGGRAPWTMFADLATEEMPWAQTAIYQVDERVAPAEDDHRNLMHLLASLPIGTGVAVHPMPVEEADLESAADDYSRSLPDVFDLVHLGLGPDGHTASLVPGDPVLDVVDRDVAVTGPYQGHRRLTLTYRALNRARHILWLVTGDDKVDALRRLLAGDASIPAAGIETARAFIVADAAAAAGAAP